MAFIDLGKLKFNWRGEWNTTTDYEVDDVVYYESQTFVATVNIAAGSPAPQANTEWELMAAGLNFKGVYDSATTYYLHDMVTYGAALYILEDISQTGSQTGIDPGGSEPEAANWKVMTPAPSANVLHAIGDMVFRNNENNDTRLVTVPQAGKGLNIVEQPLESYPSRAFTFSQESTNSYGFTTNTTGSIAAETYNFTVKVQRSALIYDNWVINGSDRQGLVYNERDGDIVVNIGDIIEFDNSVPMGMSPAHPLRIYESDGVTEITAGSGGSYSGGATNTINWNTTGSAAGVYYYKCTLHGANMSGQITLVDTTNRVPSVAGANATINVCRGKTYTITVDGVQSGITYNLYATTFPNQGTTNQITADEGMGTVGGVQYNGTAVTFDFTPNETTPNTIYLSDAINSSFGVAIIVNDVAYVPSWGTATISNTNTAGAVDNREFKYWQDWYGGDNADTANVASATWGFELPASTRDPGEDVEVGGVAVGAQQRRLLRGSSGTGNSTTWTVPDGVEKVRITCIGGGGGGSSYSSTYYGGPGGGGGSFASGEFTVTANQQLTVTCGHGGYGNWQTGGRAGTGGTSSVTGTGISVSADGGQGGGIYTQFGQGGQTPSVTGSSLISGTTIRSAGGCGGRGADGAYSSTCENCGSGGGGSAGSMYGHGYQGGSASTYDTGYFGGSAGGGGIGGHGGKCSNSYTTNDYYGPGAGGGGGSRGPGCTAAHSGHSNQGLQYGSNAGTAGGDGGKGIAESVDVPWYKDHYYNVEGKGGTNILEDAFPLNSSGTGSTQMERSVGYFGLSGARFGDGESPSPTSYSETLVDGSGHNGWVSHQLRESYGSGTSYLPVYYNVKAFNGILGHLWGGGGAGANMGTAYAQISTGNGPASYTSAWGGMGGSGAGGGGGLQYCTGTPTTNGVVDYAEHWSIWDPVNMAFRVHEKFFVESPATSIYDGSTSIILNYGGFGGHGGALGGGGGGNSYGSHGGWGGIGGGGGGASSSYSSYYSQGGHGGPGYVLIEWLKA